MNRKFAAAATAAGPGELDRIRRDVARLLDVAELLARDVLAIDETPAAAAEPRRRHLYAVPAAR